MSRVVDHKLALDSLGDSIRHGWRATGALHNYDEASGAVWFTIPIHGAKGRGKLNAQLGRVDGVWVFSHLQLVLDHGAKVDLLEASGEPARENIPTDKRLYLVPVGTSLDADLGPLPAFYKNKFGLEVQVLAPIPIEDRARDNARRQLIAEEIVASMQRKLPRLAKDPNAVLIGVTGEDMYFRERKWNFTYTYWDGDRGGAVSSARFRSVRYGEDPHLNQRVRKMISRVIGMLVFELPRNDDPSSVLAEELHGSFSADLMSDHFDGLGSRAVVDEFKTAHWLPSFPPSIRADKLNFDAKRVDGRHPCVLIQRDRENPAQSTQFKSSVTRCLPQMLTAEEVDDLEIDLRSGRVITKETDLYLAGNAPLAATRCYHPWDDKVRAFGYNRMLAWDMFPTGKRNPYSEVGINLCGHRVEFERISEGSSYTDALFEHRETASQFLGARFGWSGNGWDLDLSDGDYMFFPESYNAKRAADGAVVKFKRAKGGAIAIERDKARNVTGLFVNKREFLKFDYDSRNRVIRARDHGGRMVHYTYDLAGRLVQVQNGTSTRRYAYRGTDLASVQENGLELSRLSYTRGRIAELTLASGQSFKLAYDYNPRDDYTVVRTHLTMPDGAIRVFENPPN